MSIDASESNLGLFSMHTGNRPPELQPPQKAYSQLRLPVWFWNIDGFPNCLFRFNDTYQAYVLMAFF